MWRRGRDPTHITPLCQVASSTELLHYRVDIVNDWNYQLIFEGLMMPFHSKICTCICEPIRQTLSWIVYLTTGTYLPAREQSNSMDFTISMLIPTLRMDSLLCEYEQRAIYKRYQVVGNGPVTVYLKLLVRFIVLISKYNAVFYGIDEPYFVCTLTWYSGPLMTFSILYTTVLF